nr:hypothetical protein [Tanacetum cinerariifolium]
MDCSLSHTIDEIDDFVEKLIDEDIVHQKAIAMQFDNASTTKDDLRKVYEKCNDISQENHAILRRLRTEQEKELTLVNNLVGEMTRYFLQKLSRAKEETRVRSLPLDQPLNSYGLHTLLMTSKSDRRITTALKAARMMC